MSFVFIHKSVEWYIFRYIRGFWQRNQDERHNRWTFSMRSNNNRFHYLCSTHWFAWATYDWLIDCLSFHLDIRIGWIAKICVSSMLGHDRCISWALSKIQISCGKVPESIDKSWNGIQRTMAKFTRNSRRRLSNRRRTGENWATVKWVMYFDLSRLEIDRLFVQSTVWNHLFYMPSKNERIFGYLDEQAKILMQMMIQWMLTSRTKVKKILRESSAEMPIQKHQIAALKEFPRKVNTHKNV